ncbi:hypothetical protein GUITHDRAFT_119124 [Guillardia theta CCMP2712]|uniref:Phosphatidylinositol N-acetylglucosaminyltransferase subunit C n=1 Tax=Guillardia theta (strain CCMP2712) TaxID=905079 RepID=L1IFS6_GUITC|nr:hypothetical protein GUITHDRAFT_119124 [Guillardia theta CCMP2712]EKX34690.1 hypothetical protein GUITHDRAFT_119124 [Guillardia theta CCMP2712]|eukprot:XP_005821670.1 hypothetical protein GUITHDRAFT_119124 [Guillardia theta CCMP2712]
MSMRFASAQERTWWSQSEDFWNIPHDQSYKTSSVKNAEALADESEKSSPAASNDSLHMTIEASPKRKTRNIHLDANTEFVVLAKLLLPPWERVLWKKQPYEDNYVDRTFLESLVTNANFHAYDAWQITKDSVVVSQHLAGTVLFLGIAYLTNYRSLDLSYMLALDIVLGAAGCMAMLLAWLSHNGKTELRDLSFPASMLFHVGGLTWDNIILLVPLYGRATFLFIVALCILSPILRTLTLTISDDTVAVMAITFLSVNLLCHDYRWVNGRSSAFGGSVSLNAAMFVSVILASRASSNLHVALLMCCAVEVFALAPRVYRQVKLSSEVAHGIVTSCLVLISLALLFHISPLLGTIFGFFVFFITWICPLTFLYIQRYKNKINGPWDEAVPIRRNDRI